VNPTLQRDGVTIIKGELPKVSEQIHSETVDFLLLNNILEHVFQDLDVLVASHRVLKSGGLLYINVPSWLGKRFLEYSAFRLSLSSPEEMMDHKKYYDPKDLWPIIVKAGFNPINIKIKKTKFRLNTTAIVRK